ncbi:MAG: hypothetical protein HDR26_04075 [Lachnospiraceae bacterium]|nr:hypothetical protein [Lachnospiraceae bacterium]
MSKNYSISIIFYDACLVVFLNFSPLRFTVAVVLAIGYDIVVLINTGDINGAVKYVQEYFQCDEETANNIFIEYKNNFMMKSKNLKKKMH